MKMPSREFLLGFLKGYSYRSWDYGGWSIGVVINFNKNGLDRRSKESLYKLYVQITGKEEGR